VIKAALPEINLNNVKKGKPEELPLQKQDSNDLTTKDNIEQSTPQKL